VDDVPAGTPLPWERLLWSATPRPFVPRLRGVRYALTDFRLVRTAPGVPGQEIALQDLGEIHLSRSRVDRVSGAWTLRVDSRLPGAPPLLLAGVRRGPQLAALLEVLAGHAQARLDPESVAAALEWEPRARTRGLGEAAAALIIFVAAIAAVVVSVRGQAATSVHYAPDDPIYPNGRKRSEEDIRRFMEAEIMPWARAVLGPLKGGADRITCETCHGVDAGSHGWSMPAVAALPRPDLRDTGWERYSEGMDDQMRNAIYGYLADPEKQHRAGYMREVVLPGMAALLHRPPYDFTRPYAYNRSRLAFGCYHCHQIK
jgi:hypothetical protein